MRRNPNLTVEIKTQLPPELVSFLDQASRLAAGTDQHLYLVGGVVRDLLLKRPNYDLDLVVEGDAVLLAQDLAAVLPAKIIVHPAFRTAKLRWDQWKVDLTTARSESYRRPGALPTVQPGSLISDMYRRDFTINALAVDLNPKRYGKLIDYLGGRIDLMNGQIRVMHNESFVDDATRIWRAIRYEQRLGFHFEHVTGRLLRHGIPMLDTISGDRIRHELEAVFQEKYPELVLKRAAKLGVLTKIHPSIQADRWLSNKFKQARRRADDHPLMEIYFTLIGYRLPGTEVEELIRYLKPSRAVIRTLEESISLKTRLDTLAEPRLSPGKIHTLLEEYSTTAILVNQIAADSLLVRNRLALHLDKLRYIRPILSGDELNGLGITPGPTMKIILRELLNARLDGKVKSRADEIAFVRAWQEEYPV